MDKEQQETQAKLRWLVYFNDQLSRGDFLSKTQIAEQLGKPEAYVEKKHKDGALYAQILPRNYVEKVAAVFPDEMSRISVAVEFVRQGQELVYPAWQLREKRKPSNGHKVIRPEVKMAREAFVLYAEELAQAEQSMKVTPTYGTQPGQKPAKASDDDLVHLFNGTGGYGSSAFSTYIERSDKAKPAERMTVDQFRTSWWYHKNPFCDFT